MIEQCLDGHASASEYGHSAVDLWIDGDQRLSHDGAPSEQGCRSVSRPVFADGALSAWVKVHPRSARVVRLHVAVSRSMRSTPDGQAGIVNPKARCSRCVSSREFSGRRAAVG